MENACRGGRGSSVTTPRKMYNRGAGVGARRAMWLIRYTFIHVAPALEQLLPRRAGSCPPQVDVPAAEAREAAERRRRARRKTRSKAAQKRQDDQDFEAM